MHALILAPFDERQLERLSAQMSVTHESWLDTLKLTDPDELAARIRTEGISILVVEADFVFEETFADAPDLRFVGICRASTTQVDLDAATAHGVVVVNTPGRNARAVAEHALGLIFSLARRIPTAHNYVTSGQWRHPVGGYVDLRGIELAGRTLGIVGMGAIGRRLAEMGQALGMSVLGCDPYVTDPPDGVDMVDLHTAASSSDFISVHVPTAPQTAGMIDAEVLDCMKPTAFFVNCSDAEVIDQAALVHALTTGQNRGRGIRRLRDPPHRARQPASPTRQRHTHAPPRRRDGRDHPAPLQDDDRRHPPIRARRPSRQPRQSRSLGPPCPNDPVLVIDAGSSSIRCHLVGIDGRVTKSASRPWTYLSDPAVSQLAREFDVPACWSSLCDAIRECATGQGRVAAIAITSQRQSIVFLDSDANVLYAGPNTDLSAIFAGVVLDYDHGDLLYGALPDTVPRS